MSLAGGGPQAQIYEAGFRPYQGPRLEPGKSFVTLYKYSVGRLLGRKRRFRSKLVPIASFFVAWIGAVVLIGIAVLASQVTDLEFETVRSYYQQVGVGVVLFTVLATPTLLNADRRSGLLSLYLASPLTRGRYLNAQAGAVLSLLMVMSLVPVLIMGVVYTLLGSGPGGADDFVIFVLRTLAGAVSLALLPTALAVAICSIVRRGGLATVAIAVALLVPTGILSLLVEVARAPEEIYVLDPLRLSRALAKSAHGLSPAEFAAGTLDTLATWLVIVANLGWAAVLGGLAHVRFRRIEVER